MTTRTCGKSVVLTKFAIRYEIDPRGLPGNARFILTPSSGEVRLFASQALSLSCGMRITRPVISSGFSSVPRRLTAICPSYSLPCVPPKHMTPFGFDPRIPLMTVNGTSE